MFLPLVKTLKTSETTDKDEVIELWNEESHSSEKTEPFWSWLADSDNFEKPIIQPANYNWEICWRKGDQIIEKNRIKNIRFQRIEFGNFIIIREF